MAAVPPPGPIPAAAVAPGAGLNGQGPRNIFRDVSQHGIGAEKSSSMKLEIEKFKGTDYHLWEYQLKSILKVQGYWGVVCGAIRRPRWPIFDAQLDEYETHLVNVSEANFAAEMAGVPAAQQAATLADLQFLWDKIDEVAKTTIITSVNFKYLQLLTMCHTSHEAWVRLRTKFLEVSLPNQMRLEEEYRQVKMRRGQDVMSYINTLESYVDRLRGVGIDVAENTKIACLLRGLTQEFESIQTSILTNPTISYEHAVNLLIQWASLRGVRGNSSMPSGSVLLSEETNEETGEALLASRSNARGKGFRGRGRSMPRGQKAPAKRSSKCYGCGEEGHLQSQCPKRTNPTSRATCYTCGKVGHISPDCPQKGKASNSRGSSSSGSDRAAITFIAFDPDNPMHTCGEKETTEYEVMTDDFDIVVDDNEKAFVARKVKLDEWILDSGATQNMCNEASHFCKLKKLLTPKRIMMGDSTIIKAEYIGEIEIFTNGEEAVIKDVLYTPQMAKNLISVSQVMMQGKDLQFDSEHMICKIIERKTGKVVAKARPENNLWCLDFRVRNQPETLEESKKISEEIDQSLLSKEEKNESGIEERSLELETEDIPEFMLMNVDDGPFTEADYAAVASETEMKLWHHRFCHLGEKNLKKLQSKGMVRGLPEPKFEGAIKGSCQPCLQGKAHREPFPTPPHQPRTYEVLELVHSDVCEMPVYTYGGAKYFLTFLDEKSKRSWIYLMSHKSEVTEHFRNFKNLVEKQSGKRIKILRSDNGGEYVNAQLMEILQDTSIQHQLTVAGNPQQNGAAERLNRTLLDKVRSMIIGSGLSQKLWGEALYTANYVRNRSPTSEHQNMTPEEAYIGHKPSVAHLKVFGSKANVFVPENKRGKLDPRSWEGYFVGYGMNGQQRIPGLEP